jgi:hypothetical protein
MDIGSAPQHTRFSLDVLGRYVCNTFDEALASSDPVARANAQLQPHSTMRPFDFIVIGGGTFGGVIAEHLWFRSTGRSERILVLEAGPFLLPEHSQNLPSLGLGREVWGLSWRSNSDVPFDGLAYCVGGRSVLWGGWSPRPLDSETPAEAWPKTVLDDLHSARLPNGNNGYFRQSGQQIGVTSTNDFMFGDLHSALRDQVYTILESGRVTEAVPLAHLPDAPPVEILDTRPTLADLAALLGVPLPNPLPADPSQLRDLEQTLRKKLKLEAPLAVQARAEHAGFFPMNKFSAVPLMIKAARVASKESYPDDVSKRFMIVPQCHVTRLSIGNDSDGKRVTDILTERGPISVAPDCKVIVALGTIESTRLALLSFGEQGPIGSSLMAHLRSNIDFRIPRIALDRLSPTVQALQSSALLVKGKHNFKRADGTLDGTVGYFHLQITASGLDNINSDSEAELFQKVPDIDTVYQHLLASDSHVVITIRGIGEMEAGNPNSNVSLDRDPSQTDYGERKAYVNLHPSAKDLQLWDALDQASDELADALAAGHNIDVIARNPPRMVASGVAATALTRDLPYVIRNAANPNGRRDGLGTTHHEAGTLKMGDDPNTSVTDAHGKFHGVKNAYAVGPALFPTIGSPNPMLTGLALARRLGDHVLPPPNPAQPEPGFHSLFDGTQHPADVRANWLIANTGRGGGDFKIVDRSLIAQPGNGIGLLFYGSEQFDDFTLRLDFCLPHARGNRNDSSGVFVRFRDPRRPELPGTPGPDVPGNAATLGVDTGYEIQIDEEARSDRRRNEPDGSFYHRTGAIYDVRRRGTGPGEQDYTNTQQLAAGQWHTYEITVKDRTYTVYLNGQQSTKFTADPSDPNERFRGRKHSEDQDSGFIGLQVHDGTVAFANIRICPSP